MDWTGVKTSVVTFPAKTDNGEYTTVFLIAWKKKLY